MADESESLEAVATLRTHHLIKTYKFADDYILLAAKVEWHITTPIDVPSTAGGALLKQILILPNEQRKVDGRVEVFVGDQQANGTAAHKRIMQILQAVSVRYTLRLPYLILTYRLVEPRPARVRFSTI